MRRLALLPLLGLVFACSEQNMPTALNDEELTPSFNFTNGPVHPGNSVVFRGTVPVFWIGTDPARDLVSVNGLGTHDPSQSLPCGGAVDFDIWEFQDALASGLLVSHAVIHDPTQHIYAGIANFFSQASLCDALLLPRVAEGLGDHFRFNDNCVFGVCDNGAPRNGWTQGWRARGKLADLVNGGQVRYTETQRVVYNVGTGQFRVLVENIRLTPIGKP
jgi:hypothetical protein